MFRNLHQVLIGVCIILSTTLGTLGNTPTSWPKSSKTIKVVAGKQYKASALHKLFLGGDYRDLWTTPIEVEVLDLQSFAGGLCPVTRFGGMQTLGLAMKGADGRNYSFRGVDKDPATFLPPSFMDTLAEHLIQDQTAAANPAGTVVVPVLAELLGVLHNEPRLIVMPDDPILGEFRDDFAGALGTIEEYPSPVSETNPGFHGATEIISSYELMDRMFAGPEDQADVRAFLRARLLDFLIGDWDRHKKQWRWCKLPGEAKWQPIPEDRDQAFVNYEGLMLAWLRFRVPQLITFRSKYPTLEGLTWNGRFIDRFLLPNLERAAYVEISQDIQRKLTDEVIERAVRRMPKEYFALRGKEITSALKKRRARLTEVAERYYRHLAAQVDVHCTHKNETANVRYHINGDVEISVSLRDESEAVQNPYYHRSFHPQETKEVRIYLHDGNDHLVTRGKAKKLIKVRLIGGDGFDVVDDSQGGLLYFYDTMNGHRLIKGRDTKLDTKVYNYPIYEPEMPWVQPRDWGRRTAPRLWPGFSTDLGLFLGGGVIAQGYGFRKVPYANEQLFRVGYATRARTFRLEYKGDFRRSNSSLHGLIDARASGIEILRFYGFGNDTTSEAGDDFYKIEQNQFSFLSALGWLFGPWTAFSLGTEFKYVTITLDPDTLLGQEKPYGARDFSQVSIRFMLNFDTRDFNVSASSGFRAQIEGFFSPGIFDVDESFGGIQAETAAYLSCGKPLMLAFRIGGKRVFGKYPFHEAAFIGGTATVRGYPRERFAGDASMYGSAELRLTLGKTIILVPGEFGIFVLGDIGRIFLEGESSRKWHPAAGGGFFFSIFDLATTFSLAVATCQERTAVYFKAGFSF
jgi:hypothetical protein